MPLIGARFPGGTKGLINTDNITSVQEIRLSDGTVQCRVTFDKDHHVAIEGPASELAMGAQKWS